jgi:ubiquitin-protein ligase
MATSLDQDINRFFAKNTFFQNPEIAGQITSDIVTAVHTFRFAHKVAPWGETGQRKLCIYGPLPFPFRGQMYAVAVQVWLTSSYPVDPPVVYIVPSSDTQRLVAGHRAVDGTGMCYCPALAKWRPDVSTIKPMLVQLIKIFAFFPPLWEDKQATRSGGGGLGATGGGSEVGSTQGSAAAALLSAGVTGDDPDPEARLCVICLSEPKDTVIVPCGHCCSCSTCAASLSICPMCRGKIRFRQRVYV